MIALSSHRPHSRSVEFARNQKMAKRTWEGFFRKIIYIGEPEPELKSQKTTFMPGEDWPTIHSLATIAAAQPEVTAILNADILVNPKLRVVETRLQNGSAVCASSRRYHIDPHLPNFDRAQLIESDRGRDIFVTTPKVWLRVALQIPKHLRIGHQQWDAWMTDFFNTYKPGFIDFTLMKCIFHPYHTDRQMPFAQDIVAGSSREPVSLISCAEPGAEPGPATKFDK